MIDTMFGAGGLSSVTYGLTQLSGNHVGTAIFEIGLGLAVIGAFVHAADVGDDRAADCRAALLDYQYEISQSLARSTAASPSPPVERESPRSEEPEQSDTDDAPTE